MLLGADLSQCVAYLNLFNFFEGAEISLSKVLILASVIFGLSIFGILINRKNLITLLMSIELMLLAVSTNFIAFSHFAKHQNSTLALSGEIFVFFILTVAAAEAAIGLAILVVFFRTHRSIEIQDMNVLKG